MIYSGEKLLILGGSLTEMFIIEEARKILKDSGLDINIEKDESLNEKETIIKEQLPKKGIKLKAGSKVIISY